MGEHGVPRMGEHGVPRMGEHGVPRMGEHGVPGMGEHGVPGMGKHGVLGMGASFPPSTPFPLSSSPCAKPVHAHTMRTVLLSRWGEDLEHQTNQPQCYSHSFVHPHAGTWKRRGSTWERVWSTWKSGWGEYLEEGGGVPERDGKGAGVPGREEITPSSRYSNPL